MLNLKDMDLKQLEELKEKINKEITKRTFDNLVLYTHDCKSRSKHHLNKYKHWSKLLDAVDTTKTNGYAFKGKWLNINHEHKIPIGSIILEVCDTTIVAYKITEEGKETIDDASIRSMSKFIDNIAKYV